MGDKARECALSIVRRVCEQGAYSNIEITTAVKKYGLTGVDRAFCVALVNGVIERLYPLDYLISKASGRKTEDIDKELLSVLRLGFLQLYYMNVPDMAACNESAALVKNKGRRGFVNAVMRNACRSKEKLIKDMENEAEGYVKASLSPDIYSLIVKQYPQEAAEIMEAFYGQNALCLRVNPLKTSSDSLAEGLREKGAEVEVKEKTLLITKGADAALEAVGEGLAIVQGLSSQKAVEALQAREGHTVIDVCACPGGKTLGAAMDMNGKGSVISMDLHENKLTLIQKTAASLGVTIVETKAHDGRKPVEEFFEIADRVICDVPCSGIGAIKGRPEIRYKSLLTVENLIDTQRAILSGAWTYLKKGGRLVYSTCTINKDENEGVLVPFAEKTGAVIVEMRTVLPTEPNHDGFYIAVLEKA